MTIRWSYALNQWRTGHDHFVLRRDHEVAFKTVSISGFDAVELEAGSGRWEPLGQRDSIKLHYGSVRALRDAMKACALSGASSYYFDPSWPIFEEGAFGRSVLNRDDHAPILRTLRQYVEMLPQLGGSMLVARALPAFAATKVAPAEAMATAAECWNAVGAMAAEHGVGFSIKLDAVSILRSVDDVAALMDLCDPAAVGLSIDTADAAIAGIDPIGLYRRLADRTRHVQLGNTRQVDETGDYRLPNPDKTMIAGGGAREIERWYCELGDDRGLVDVAAFHAELLARDYDGWVVVESEQSPVPATSAMLNGWFVNRLTGRKPWAKAA
jgi:inosose dehydratase